VGYGRSDALSEQATRPQDTDVRAIRSRLGMTQVAFAATFGFPLTTLRDWEQGRTRPDTATRSYLIVIEQRPEAVREALAAA
jgi:putative transcriptional regulator